MKPRLSVWEKEIASIEGKIVDDKSKLHLKGLAGSAPAFICSAFYSSSPVTQLVVLDDKEKAAYFLNDLESILEIGSDEKEQEKTSVLFFPRTARLAYDVETTQNANIAIRTEVLNKIQKNRKNYIVVSYPEALFEKVVTHHELEKNTFSIDVGQSYSMDFIDEVFIEFQFVHICSFKLW